MYPKVTINLKKIEHNTKLLCNLCGKHSISVTGVTKVFGADNKITESVIKGGITYLGDSRIQNLKKLQNFKLEKTLLRIPMQSEVEDVVRYSDCSLNSDITTINLLNQTAGKSNKIHSIILMIDLGDLREGIWFEDKNLILDIAAKVLKSKNLKLAGIGTNLSCYGGVLATAKNMNTLVNIASMIEDNFKIKLDIISGGNSSSLHLMESLPNRINNLRLGESLVLGRETAFGKQIPDTFSDAFTLEAEIIELYQKPSVPVGQISMNAFGETPVFKDKGTITKALIAIGKQDINPDSLKPLDSNITILGASSDHLITEIKTDKYNVGDVLSFSLNYEGILHSMASEYIYKNYM